MRENEKESSLEDGRIPLALFQVVEHEVDIHEFLLLDFVLPLNFANDASKAKQLWDLSENLGGVEFKLSSKQVTKGEKSTDAPASTS